MSLGHLSGEVLYLVGDEQDKGKVRVTVSEDVDFNTREITVEQLLPGPDKQLTFSKWNKFKHLNGS